jgi:hypothetical protein
LSSTSVSFSAATTPGRTVTPRSMRTFCKSLHAWRVCCTGEF